ncbi:MAG: hypothetical protein JXB36_11560 [Gammaproteobacteria bacterium]|nr:hypothetical protein [Gammaproteobacteria bacterium]
MEVARETPQANVVRAWEPGRVRIGERWLEGSVIIAADRIMTEWAVDTVGEVDVASLEPAISLQPEIIVLGTGEDIVLPDVELMGALAARAIGLEIMTTAAACRTFNVLVHEERRVVAALLNPPPR